jgi:[lysine-biosynthesis-protein LysW]--L-2-aminoadipate ligase
MIFRHAAEVERNLAAIRRQGWFRRHGVLVQDLVPAQGYDLGIVVAGDRVVGAGQREAAAGELRTNVALGGRFITSSPPPGAGTLAIDAARAIGADLVGVGLLPDPRHGYLVLEVNGAVDFNEDEESLAGCSVYADTAEALALGQTHLIAA